MLRIGSEMSISESHESLFYENLITDTFNPVRAHKCFTKKMGEGYGDSFSETARTFVPPHTFCSLLIIKGHYERFFWLTEWWYESKNNDLTSTNQRCFLHWGSMYSQYLISKHDVVMAGILPWKFFIFIMNDFLGGIIIHKCIILESGRLMYNDFPCTFTWRERQTHTNKETNYFRRFLM